PSVRARSRSPRSFARSKRSSSRVTRISSTRSTRRIRFRVCKCRSRTCAACLPPSRESKQAPSQRQTIATTPTLVDHDSPFVDVLVLPRHGRDRNRAGAETVRFEEVGRSELRRGRAEAGRAPRRHSGRWKGVHLVHLADVAQEAGAVSVALRERHGGDAWL